MSTRKPKAARPEPRTVRKSLSLDADKLEKARQLLGTSSDAETLRVALDHLLSHYQPDGEEE